MLIKNPKGRIVSVTDAHGEYLLADKPTSNILGDPITNDKGQPVVLVKSEHEKGFSKPTAEEIKAFEKGTAKTDAKAAKSEADKEAAKAAKEQKKADEAKAKADEKKADADAKAAKTEKASTPTPDNA